MRVLGSLIGALVLFRRWGRDETLEDLDFSSCPIWVRIFNLPPSQVTLANVHRLGEYLGGVLEHELDESEEGFGWSDFLRLRICWPLVNPLVDSIPVIMDDGRSVKLDVRYEKLPEFCFYCGVIGHTTDGCELQAKVKSGKIAAPDLGEYGPWLKAEEDRIYRSLGGDMERRPRLEDAHRLRLKEAARAIRGGRMAREMMSTSRSVPDATLMARPDIDSNRQLDLCGARGQQMRREEVLDTPDYFSGGSSASGLLTWTDSNDDGIARSHTPWDNPSELRNWRSAFPGGAAGVVVSSVAIPGDVEVEASMRMRAQKCVRADDASTAHLENLQSLNF